MEGRKEKAQERLNGTLRPTGMYQQLGDDGRIRKR